MTNSGDTETCMSSKMDMRKSVVETIATHYKDKLQLLASECVFRNFYDLEYNVLLLF